MGILSKLNPLKRRPFGGARPAHGPRSEKHTREALEILRKNPNVADSELMTALGLVQGQEPIIQEARRRLTKEKLLAPYPEKPPAPAPAPEPASGVQIIKNGDLSLVTFSPEELLKQVEERRSRVSFDLSGTARFMDNYNQVWSWAGPILFAIGTIGEIFLVLWGRQKVQDWFTGFTIIVVSVIAEGTLLGISFSAKRLRNRADKRSTGWTDKERHKLDVLKKFWLALAVGVAATQVAFVVAQTNAGDIGELAVWIIAIVRSLAALVADAYTAFVSEEKPTSGELAIEQQDRETEFTKKLLDQKALEVETINAGAIKVQEVGIEASMRQDRMHTQREIARMQNLAQIESMRAEQEQKVLIDRMRNSAMRAIFDPEMPGEQRQSIIGMLTGLMGATKDLPPPRTIVTPEDEDEV